MELKNRSQYLDKLISVQDMEVIKVVTGIRRCGKSSLLKLMMVHLRKQGVMEEQILSMNFESMQFADMDSKSLYQYVMERAPKGKRLYLFLDEVQKVRDWQDAVNSFRVDLDCDIYVTGSNAYLLSSELSTYLSGRYNAATLEFPPLSRIPPFRVHATLQRRYGIRRKKGPVRSAVSLRDRAGLFSLLPFVAGRSAAEQADRKKQQPGHQQKRYRPPDLTGLGQGRTAGRRLRGVRRQRRLRRGIVRDLRCIGIGHHKGDPLPFDPDRIALALLFDHRPGAAVIQPGPRMAPAIPGA